MAQVDCQILLIAADECKESLVKSDIFLLHAS